MRFTLSNRNLLFVSIAITFLTYLSSSTLPADVPFVVYTLMHLPWLYAKIITSPSDVISTNPIYRYSLNPIISTMISFITIALLWLILLLILRKLLKKVFCLTYIPTGLLLLMLISFFWYLLVVLKPAVIFQYCTKTANDYYQQKMTESNLFDTKVWENNRNLEGKILDEKWNIYHKCAIMGGIEK